MITDVKGIVVDKIKKLSLLIMVIADIFIVLFTGIVLYYIGGFVEWVGITAFIRDLGILVCAVIFFQFIFRVYNVMWIYAGSKEYLNLFNSALMGFIFYLALNMVFYTTDVPTIFMLAIASCSLLGMFALRFFYRIMRRRMSVEKTEPKPNSDAKKADDAHYVAIIGAGDAGVALFHEISRNPAYPYKVWCFFDDNEAKIGKIIHGLEVKGPINELPKIIKSSPVYDVILAIPSLDLQRRQEIVKMCSQLQCRLKILPDTMAVIENSDLSLSNSIREVKVEDLLGRTPVRFNRKDLYTFLRDKVILVTGGGGSIGSELCRQIAVYQPKKIIIFDICENTPYDLVQELRYLFKDKLDTQIEIGSVRDKKRVEEIFEAYRPEVVFHAAAHKHVPLMENNPAEAIKNNILGTHNLLLAAHRYHCGKFVMISTDKAVNPTNVMGATKRFCEMMVQSMAELKNCRTDFVAVRFGNVLGSNGSVIPLFKRQIEHGGPVTITDKRITRYFMTIPEAASLVLKAGAMADKSEIFVLDMGEPVKIIDLAENLIRLSGFKPYEEIKINEVGLRPGEKLFEELLINKDLHDQTSNKKIFIEKQIQTYPYQYVMEGLEKLMVAVELGDKQQILLLLKELVPTYKDPQVYNALYCESRAEGAEEKKDNLPTIGGGDGGTKKAFSA